MKNDIERKLIISQLVKTSATVQTAYKAALSIDDHALAKQLRKLGEDVAAAICAVAQPNAAIERVS